MSDLRLMTTGNPDHDLLVNLRDTFDRDLLEVVGPSARVALLDYPYSRNSGDAAIWLGERASLRRIGAQVVYACETESYTPLTLNRVLGHDDPILLHGGGNFGDYWPQHQEFREKVLADFPTRRIIQLPQSIGVRHEGSASRIKDAMARHRNFLMLVRDRASLALSRDRLGLDTRLVPDCAFALGPIDPPREPVSDVLVLARTDHERAHGLADISLPRATVEDWRLSNYQQRLWMAKKIVPRLTRRWKSVESFDRSTGRARLAIYDSMARQTVAQALQQLSSYRTVVTDRLHAHVMSTLLGLPHVVLDNDYGKISGLHQAWTRSSLTTHFAVDVSQAAETTLKLLDRLASAREPASGRRS